MTFHAFLVTGLQPNSSHTFTVRSVDARGHESADSVPVTVTTAPEYGNTINVTAFGAKCDNKTADTTVIQAAIDRCSNGSTSAFGCRVVVPAGRICVTGALSLRSNMTLEVAAGAMLRASTNVSDFAGSSASSPLPMLGAINGNYQNIRLLGPGTLDGNGWLLDSRVVDELNNSLPVYAKGNANTVSQLGLLAKAQVEAAGGAYSARSTLATFGKVTNLYIGSLRVVNPSKDTIKVQNSRNIVVANLRLHTYNVNNGDGVGFSSSQNALAFNNFFNTGDDCIATAAGQGLAGQQSRQPVQHLWVFNNYFREGHGAFVVGSQTAAWMQDILVEDNVLFRTDNGLRLKSTPVTGGGARRIVFRDSAMLGVGVMQGIVSLGGRDFPINQTDLGGQYTQSPFIFTLAYTAGAAASSPANQSAQFRDIRVQRVSVDNGRPGQGGSFMAVDGYAGTDATLGYPESFHRNLTFLDVKFTNVAPANISRLANSTFTNVTISNWGNASSSPWAIRDSQNLTFTNVLCGEEECQF